MTETTRQVGRIENLAQNAVFNTVLKAYGALGLPAMTAPERALYERLLVALHDSKRAPLRLFEYGSGHSTVYFGRRLRDRGVPFHLDTLDNHRGWHDRVSAAVDRADLSGSVDLHLRVFAPFWEKSGWDWDAEPACGDFAPSCDAEREYIALPESLGGGYDLILVDARFRRRCLEVASRSLAPGGVVVLHDAQKPHYHAPFDLFEVRRMVDGGTYYPGEHRLWQVWLGSHDNRLIEEV